MVCKFCLLVLSVGAMLALLAPSASAFEVKVQNPDILSITGENTLAIHTFLPESLGGSEVTGLKCDNRWEANVNSDGHVHIHDVATARHAESTPQCDAVEACDEWERPD